MQRGFDFRHGAPSNECLAAILIEGRARNWYSRAIVMVFQRSCNSQSMLSSILKGNVRADHQDDTNEPTNIPLFQYMTLSDCHSYLTHDFLSAFILEESII